MNDKITINIIQPEDADAVYAIEEEVFADNFPWPREWFDDAVSGEDGGYVYVAHYENQLAGFCIMYHNTNMEAHDFHYCKIGNIAVKPEFRGKQIGRALMMQMLKRAAELGLDRIKLETSEKNTAAISLYKSLGFKITDTLPGYYGDAEDGFVMWLHTQA